MPQLPKVRATLEDETSDRKSTGSSITSYMPILKIHRFSLRHRQEEARLQRLERKAVELVGAAGEVDHPEVLITWASPSSKPNVST